jgi:hypothetical protein
MKVSTEIDNNFGYEKITQLVDNIPLRMVLLKISQLKVFTNMYVNHNYVVGLFSFMVFNSTFNNI